MAQHIACPGCGQRLLLPDDLPATGLTCPHCLAPIAPGSEGIRPDAPARPPATMTSCPRCGQPVEPGWRYCPECRRALRERGGLRAPDLDLDVRRDTRGTGVGLILLAVLGALGIGYALLGSLVAVGEGESLPFFLVLGAVFILALVSTAIVYARQPDRGRPPGPGRVVFGTLALAGGLIAAWLTLLVALAVFFFAVCLAAGGR